MPEIVKRALMTGLGDGYFQKMKTEETASTPPVYDTEIGVEIVPSLESAPVEMTYQSSPVYLSNKKHSDLGKLTDVRVTLNAAYLPAGFAEWATGSTKIGPGAYAYDDNPIRPFFRFAFPSTDENGNDVIYNFPKCQMEPVGISPQSETDSKTANITAYNIVGNALLYKPSSDLTAKSGNNNNLYLKVDTREEDAKALYDVNKLLEDGWYDTATLEAAKLETDDPEVP